MDKMNCSICNKPINKYDYYLRCCDAYVCSARCSQKRYNYIKSIDPNFTYSHAWNYKKLTPNQFGTSSIVPEKISPVYNLNLTNDNSISETNIIIKSDTDDEIYNKTNINNNNNISKKIITVGMFCIINFIKFLNPE